LYSENKLLEIESLLKDVLSQERQALGERHGTVAVTLLDLASLLKSGNKPAEAAKCHREALEIASNLRADATNANLLNTVAWRLVTAENATDGDEIVAIELAQKAVSATKRASAKMLHTLAAACAAAGQFTNAVRAQLEAIAIQQDDTKKKDYGFRLKLYESNSPYRDHFQLSNRTAALLAGGKFGEAEPLARQCLALREKEIPDGWWTFNARSMLGGSLLGQKKYSEAEPLLLSGYEGLKQREDKISPAGKPRLKETLQRLVQLYEATGRPDHAAEWRRKLEPFNDDGTGKKTATSKEASK
jgi:tetratricopeptide (TPR) repeat protein